MAGLSNMRRVPNVSWFVVALGLFAIALLPWAAKAQSILSGGIIEEIRIEGAQRVDATTVRSYMRVNPGEPFDPVKIDSSLKSLFATGLFADVTLRRDGNALIVVVTENPIINQIGFEGNLRIDDEILEAEVELRPRVVFTRTKVQSDLQRILELYRRQGRFAATVDAKVIQLDQNRVDLVFEINEGPTTKIQSINFIGNRAFSDGSLRDEIATSETAFWRFLSSTDTFDPDRLTFDRELLRRFYLQEGYADFQILSVVAELTPDRESFIVTFTLEEGPQYTFGDIEITTTLKDLDPESLTGQITAASGETYDASEVEDTISNLTESASNLGFAFVDVRPRVERDRDQRLINLTFEIREGPKVYVERIDIEGNIRTLDRVIRRERRGRVQRIPDEPFSAKNREFGLLPNRRHEDRAGKRGRSTAHHHRGSRTGHRRPLLCRGLFVGIRSSRVDHVARAQSLGKWPRHAAQLHDLWRGVDDRSQLHRTLFPGPGPFCRFRPVPNSQGKQREFLRPGAHRRNCARGLQLPRKPAAGLELHVDAGEGHQCR
jgi:hypothetical protein